MTAVAGKAVNSADRWAAARSYNRGFANPLRILIFLRCAAAVAFFAGRWGLDARDLDRSALSDCTVWRKKAIKINRILRRRAAKDSIALQANMSADECMFMIQHARPGLRFAAVLNSEDVMKTNLLRFASVVAFATIVTCIPTTKSQAQTVGVGVGGRGVVSESDLKDLTERRIEVVRNTLQLTAEQEKYWGPIEEAIRSRAKGRQARLADVSARFAKLQESGPIAILSDPNPIEFLNVRAKRLAERAAEAKKVADAWQPLYQTLKVDQKRRLAFVLLYVLHEIVGAADEQSIQIDEWHEE